MDYVKKKTKIVATMGPACADKRIARNMIKHGVNVFRFNMKHGTMEEHHANIEMVQKIADDLKTPVGMLIDLQGPEIRLQTIDKEKVVVKANEKIAFTRKFRNTFKEPQVRIPHDSVFKALEVGDRFSIDDGIIQMEVVEKEDLAFKAISKEDTVIQHMKSMNLFGKDIELPSLIKDDIKRLTIADTKKVDYVALSFARTRKDIDELRKHMQKKNIDAQIVAKIESQAAIDNIDELISESDAIMIARGDLGIETPIEKLAYYQKLIINKCRQENTPVIVATQMLESMMERPLPTRAEATDVANAVLDGADALMLSGETAIGKYPEKAVKEMAKIAMFNEKKSEIIKFDITPHNATELIVEAAETISENSQNIDIKQIIVMTETGYTAKVLAAFRPKLPMIAITDNQKTVETLTLSYGINPIKMGLPTGKLVSPDFVTKKLKSLGKLKKDDQVLVIHGQHWKKPGQTNAIVLVRVE